MDAGFIGFYNRVMKDNIEEFKKIVECHTKKYPLMEPQDYGKLAYQSEYGPEHMIKDEISAAAYMQKEQRECTKESECEPIGNGLYRYHMSADDDPDVLAHLFARTAREHKGTPQGLEARLSIVESIDKEGMREWLEDYKRQGCPSLHHSEIYRHAYEPHYRLLSIRYGDILPLVYRIQSLMKEKDPVIVSIDGRCGSGKSTLAELLSELFSCSVFHTDDFYLPFEKRIDNWQSVPCANMDIERLKKEILEPVIHQEKVIYRAYRCRDDFYEERQLQASSLYVVEGSYGQMPELSGYYDLKIFLTSSKDVQKERLQQREGENYPMFEERWIPLEEGYYRLYDVPEKADLLLCTDQW